MVPGRYGFNYTENEKIHPFISGKDAYDLMTGAWVPRKGPSSALFLIADTRPLILRAVGSRSNYFRYGSDYYCVISGPLHLELFVVHDPRRSHIASYIWCVRVL